MDFDKRGGWNKRGGWKIFMKSMNVEGGFFLVEGDVLHRFSFKYVDFFSNAQIAVLCPSHVGFASFFD